MSPTRLMFCICTHLPTEFCENYNSVWVIDFVVIVIATTNSKDTSWKVTVELLIDFHISQIISSLINVYFLYYFNTGFLQWSRLPRPNVKGSIWIFDFIVRYIIFNGSNWIEYKYVANFRYIFLEQNKKMKNRKLLKNLLID